MENTKKITNDKYNQFQSVNKSNSLQQSNNEIEILERGEVCENILFEIHFNDINNYKNYALILDQMLKKELPQKSTDSNIQIKSFAEMYDECESTRIKLLYTKIHNENDECQFANNETDKLRKIKGGCERDLAKAQSPDLFDVGDLFVVDKKPLNQLNSIAVPSYKRITKEVLTDDANKETDKATNLAQNQNRKSCCFNCGSKRHTLRLCQKPHNKQRIRVAMKAFHKTQRYHTYIDSKFKHLQPGQLSSTLRHAIGLKQGELPFFFYRMRKYGYPPAWLEDAKVEKSGLCLFNADGKKVVTPDDDDINRTKYIASKIFDFPGFNKYPGDKFYDDYKYHRVPRFSKSQSKTEFLKKLGNVVTNGYTRKKTMNLPSCEDKEPVTNTTITAEEDMEIEDANENILEQIEFIEPLPPPKDVFNQNTSPSPSTEIQLSEMQSSSHPVQSSSEVVEKNRMYLHNLADLEAKRYYILNELQADTSNASSSTANILMHEASTVQETPSPQPFSSTNYKDYKVQQMEVKTENRKHSRISGTIKETYIGGPILKFTPYDCVPSNAKFREGIGDYMNFLNVAEKTGKYERMQQILSKTRKTLHKLNLESDN